LVWSLAEPPDGVALEEDADGTWLAVAGDAAPGSAVIDLAVTTSAGDELAALKSVEVGEARDNPGPMGLVADEEPVTGVLRVPARAAVALRADIEGSEEAQLSWFATVGEIELYRRNPTELAAPEDASDGWLIAVVRDRTGGVAWQIVSLVVDP
ncbi:MAG TPA: hypothetical protein VNO33_15700, partial [Kofleriaceae bacterium]|nr:hypothetical protein [Kofleriaceae bacterium]